MSRELCADIYLIVMGENIAKAGSNKVICRGSQAHLSRINRLSHFLANLLVNSELRRSPIYHEPDRKAREKSRKYKLFNNLRADIDWQGVAGYSEGRVFNPFFDFVLAHPSAMALC